MWICIRIFQLVQISSDPSIYYLLRLNSVEIVTNTGTVPVSALFFLGRTGNYRVPAEEKKEDVINLEYWSFCQLVLRDLFKK